MADTRVVLNLRGINAVMKSEGVQADLDARARRIAEAAGEGFESTASPHRWVGRAYAQTADFVGMLRESRERALSRALDAGRG